MPLVTQVILAATVHQLVELLAWCLLLGSEG